MEMGGRVPVMYCHLVESREMMDLMGSLAAVSSSGVWDFHSFWKGVQNSPSPSV